MVPATDGATVSGDRLLLSCLVATALLALRLSAGSAAIGVWLDLIFVNSAGCLPFDGWQQCMHPMPEAHCAVMSCTCSRAGVVASSYTWHCHYC